MEALRAQVEDLERNHEHKCNSRARPMMRAHADPPSSMSEVESTPTSLRLIRQTMGTPIAENTGIAISNQRRLNTSLDGRETIVCRGNAPPVETFMGKTTTLRFEDWLPTLERASIWNQWDETEQLLQLTGHLKKQEWNLLTASKRSTYQSTTESLKSRLDTGSRLLVAQDFRYAVQKDGELVADFICRLERLFQIAHDHEQLSAETRETFLYSQLQEGFTVQDYFKSLYFRSSYLQSTVCCCQTRGKADGWVTKTSTTPAELPTRQRQRTGG